MAKQITLRKEQLEDYFEAHHHPSVERRIQKAEESIGVSMVVLYYGKGGRLYKVKHYFEDDTQPMLGGELDGYLEMINPTNAK